jgi:hypothetical protein
MNLAEESALWDIVYSLAGVRLFLDREGFVAELPGIIITGARPGHQPEKRSHHYTLHFGSGLYHKSFNKFKDACLHALEMVDKATAPVSLRVEGQSAKRFLRIQKARKKKRELLEDK